MLSKATCHNVCNQIMMKWLILDEKVRKQNNFFGAKFEEFNGTKGHFGWWKNWNEKWGRINENCFVNCNCFIFIVRETLSP